MTLPPNPWDELLRWVRANRPDMMEGIVLLQMRLGRSSFDDATAAAVRLLVGAAFDAGRWFERANSSLPREEAAPLLGLDPYR